MEYIRFHGKIISISFPHYFNGLEVTSLELRRGDNAGSVNIMD